MVRSHTYLIGGTKEEKAKVRSRENDSNKSAATRRRTKITNYPFLCVKIIVHILNQTKLPARVNTVMVDRLKQPQHELPFTTITPTSSTTVTQFSLPKRAG